MTSIKPMGARTQAAEAALDAIKSGTRTDAILDAHARRGRARFPNPERVACDTVRVVRARVHAPDEHDYELLEGACPECGCPMFDAHGDPTLEILRVWHDDYQLRCDCGAATRLEPVPAPTVLGQPIDAPAAVATHLELQLVQARCAQKISEHLTTAEIARGRHQLTQDDRRALIRQGELAVRRAHGGDAMAAEFAACEAVLACFDTAARAILDSGDPQFHVQDAMIRRLRRFLDLQYPGRAAVRAFESSLLEVR